MHLDRRNAASAERAYSVEDDALVIREGDAVKRRIALAEIVEVRLLVEMAGTGSQIVCRIRDGQDEAAVFGSASWAGPGDWTMNALTFRDLLKTLHQALEPRWAEIRFREGQSLGFTLIMFALGAILAAMGLFFFVYLAIIEENMAGWAGLGAAALGGYLALLFQPRRPKAYDPAVYARPAGDDAGSGESQTPG